MTQHIYDGTIVFNSGVTWDMDEMLDQAWETLIWTGTAEINGEPVSLSDDEDLEAAVRDYGIHPIERENLRESMRFMLSDLTDDEMEECGRVMEAAQFAHDYVLTAQRQGTGFWDRGYGALGDKLTQLAHDWSDAAGTLMAWWEADEENGERYPNHEIAG